VPGWVSGLTVDGVVLDEGEARRRFAAARVARLATADEHGRPHVVPVTFAVHGDIIVTAVDHKPKRSTNLKRLRNITANPRVSVLVDHYDDDWARLWWARADGIAHIHDHDRDAALRLRAKYQQYADHLPAGPVLRIEVASWSGWQF
jgi:PPOX class probable F420-dependent enzyme